MTGKKNREEKGTDKKWKTDKKWETEKKKES